VDTLNYTHVIKRLFLRDYFSGKKPIIVDYIEKYRIVLDVENFVNWGFQFAFFAVAHVYENMENQLYKNCLQKSAQAWCQEKTSHIEMIPELAGEFAKILYNELKVQDEFSKQEKTLNQQDRNQFDKFVFSLKEFRNLRDQIQLWKESGAGINSNSAQNIIDAVLDLCLVVKNYETHTSNLEVGHPYHPATISENYSAPIQTGVNQWSVFVRKFKGHKECIGVIEHRFKTEESAKIFSENNWCLGDYY